MGGGGLPYAAAFANKVSPPFQADWADAEPFKFALRDLDSICERPVASRGAGRPDHRITTERKASKAASSLCLCTAVRHVLMSMACAAGRTLANGSPRTAWPSAGSVSHPLGFLPRAWSGSAKGGHIQRTRIA